MVSQHSRWSLQGTVSVCIVHHFLLATEAPEAPIKSVEKQLTHGLSGETVLGVESPDILTVISLNSPNLFATSAPDLLS